MTTKLLTQAQAEGIAKAFSEVSNLGGRKLCVTLLTHETRVRIDISVVYGVDLKKVQRRAVPAQITTESYDSFGEFCTAYGLN